MSQAQQSTGPIFTAVVIVIIVIAELYLLTAGQTHG